MTIVSLQNSLRSSLSTVTGISNLDYWGMAPDSDFPKVGNVWPSSVVPPSSGRPLTVEFTVALAIWAESMPELLLELSLIGTKLVQAYGSATPCPNSLTGISGVELGNLVIGAPSLSAVSSNGVLGSGWASVNFTLTLTAL